MAPPRSVILENSSGRTGGCEVLIDLGFTLPGLFTESPNSQDSESCVSFSIAALQYVTALEKSSSETGSRGSCHEI